MNLLKVSLGLTFALFFTVGAQASVVNGGFENNFSDWVGTGDNYLVTDVSGVRTRHDYLNYLGWDGADVWFGGSPDEGNTYAVFGSNGNESNGTLTSSLWTATNQFVTFSQAGNNTSAIPVANRAFAAILDEQGNELGRVDAISYNDSIWRQWQLDLSSFGLKQGDSFRFYYQDGYSWSILDNIKQEGALLASSAPVSIPLSLLSLGMFGFFLKRKMNSDRG